MTFDLTEIEEMIPQLARKQLEAELETSYCSLVASQLFCSVQSTVQSRVQVLQRPSGISVSWLHWGLQKLLQLHSIRM